jgi:phage tail-like protein
MDANGSRFHLVLTKAEWSGDHDAPGLAWSERTHTLSLAPRTFLVSTAGASAPPAIGDRRGAGRDRYGNWYWISTDRNEIRFRGSRAKEAERYWPRPEAEPSSGESDTFAPCAPAAPVSRAFSGLAVTTDHFLVAGVPPRSAGEAGGLLIFDLHDAGAPFELQWPSDAPFDPFDIAPAPGGGVWVLDRANRRVWRMDPHFRACAEQWSSPPRAVVLDFGDAVPGRPCVPAQRAPSRAMSIERAIPLSFADAIAVEGLPDGSVLVLETREGDRASVVHRYKQGRRVWNVRLDRALAGRLAPNPDRPPRPEDLAIAAHDCAFVSDANAPVDVVQGQVLLLARSGNQAFAFRLDDTAAGSLPGGVGALQIPPEPDFYPLRLFGGKAFVAAGAAAHYDIGERWVVLARQPRPRFAREGICVLPSSASRANAFDSHLPGCVWHRVFIDACVPPDCEVVIESRAADRAADLADAITAWRPEPGLYRRHTGSEIAYHKPSIGSTDRAGTHEVLLQQAVGRYLQLRVTLRGSGRSTPMLQALRVYYPRFSYVKEYLPAVYREDRESALFLERYLANPEGFFTDIESRIEHVAALIDHRLVPPEYLEWLAGWLGATLDTAWPVERRRLFLANAWRMFQERGTPRGLSRMIRLTLDECVDDSLFDPSAAEPPFSVRIAEAFQARSAPGVDLADPSQPSLPAIAAPDAPWTPRLGAAPLHARFQSFLRTRYATVDELGAAWDEPFTSFTDVRFSVAPVGQRRRASDWREFVSTALGFTYIAPQPSDTRWFHDFLTVKYRHIGELHRAYALDPETAPASFADMDVPAAIPDGGPALRDWIEFVSVFLPLRRAASRFTVLVPAQPKESHLARQRKLEVARRIAWREKPAHTDFEVGLYWALFRVGDARLGADTLLGESSRVVAIELGATATGDGFLAPAHPWDIDDRAIVGRERFGGGPGHRTPALLEH